MPKIIDQEPELPGPSGTPFAIDGQPVARIHHDAGHVPYLLLKDEHGNAWRIYGYAQVALAGGGGGEWLPNRPGMQKVIDVWRRNRAHLGELSEMLKGE